MLSPQHVRQSCLYRKSRPTGEWVRIGRCCCPMWDFCRLTWWALVGLFRSRRALEAENLVLRQQINVLRRTAPERLLLSSIDRLIFVAMDLFVVPTISFRLLYGLLILRHDRRRILWLGATAHPTAEWIAHQLAEACGWERAPEYLIHDRDRAYG